MNVTGQVYCESKVEWKHEAQASVVDLVAKAKINGVRMTITFNQANFSWNHEDQWQMVAKFELEFDEEDLNLSIDEYIISCFLRDFMEVYMTNEIITPSYYEDVVVSTYNDEVIHLEDNYLISNEVWGDDYENDLEIPTRIAWENFKRSREFIESEVFDETASAFGKWRKKLSNLRDDKAVAPNIKRKKKVKAVESKASSNRKIFILEDVIQ